MPVSDESSTWVEEQFTSSIVPTLIRYIEIPNKSPAFDADWKQAGHMERAVLLLGRAARRAHANHLHGAARDGRLDR
jgi:hypothetical protein